ncbi:tetratricopeptide repeat protein [Streptomyces sp. NBC_00102]|uniref:tetratricopeptide repeat protein n=1 Tax=Streptomyces sp. NBC_00102 TaxID=2975652 RepID=UPI002253E9D6|nr:tetratricopeptide repeat protein [Streptomyces sp. NBC_00102]MCX5399114.1 tetratricopeptide repeat protein [Streptomyces sp. NBC_00102]
MPATRTVSVDCHAFKRYPYVGCNDLMSQLFPEVGRDRPDLVREFVRSLVTVAPDTRAGVLELHPDLVDILGEPGTIPFGPGQREEGLYPLGRTTWLSHGVVSLILRWRSELADAPVLTLSFTDVAMADPLQAEFLEILARRADPNVLRVVRDDEDGLEESGPRQSAVRLSPEGHRLRAAELMAQGRRSLDLSAVLHHLERSDASSEVIFEAFSGAAEHYLAMGFYEASLHTARIAARYAPAEDPVAMRTVCSVTVHSLMRLGRLDEAEEFCAAQLAAVSDPITAMSCSYARGIIHARLRPRNQRDLVKAEQFLECALEYVDSAPQGPSEIGNRIFLDKNFRALLAVRAGRTDEALRLGLEGLDDIQRLCPDRRQAESPVFYQNVAKVYIALKRPDLAVACYTEAIALEPFSAGIHAERGDAHRAAGDHHAALADYRLALRAGPPSPEMHFNAGLGSATVGDVEQALREYGHALELDAAFVPARLNRAGLHYRAGRLDEAARDVRAGLRAQPRHPDLLCLRGLMKLASGDPEAAFADFSEVLTHHPSHPVALKNRSSALWAMGNLTDALHDADRFLAVRADDAAGYLNRGYLHQCSGSWREALADYQKAARYGDVDRVQLTQRRSACISGLVDEYSRG